MSTPAPVLPTETPKWDSTAVKFLLVAVPVVLALWKPGHAFNSATSQAVIVGAGIIAAGLAHIVDLLVTNIRKFGVSKLAFENVYYDEDTWVHANLNDLKDLYAELKSVPDVSGAITNVTTHVTNIEKKLDAIPAVDRTAIVALIREEVQKYFDAKAQVPQVPIP